MSRRNKKTNLLPVYGIVLIMNCGLTILLLGGLKLKEAIQAYKFNHKYNPPLQEELKKIK